MALALDASTPAVTSVTGPATAATSPTFSPPANTVLFVAFGVQTSGAAHITSITNTGTALTWNSFRLDHGCAFGCAEVWYAVNASAQSGITVTVNWTPTAFSGAHYGSLRVLVFTGAATTQTGASTIRNNVAAAAVSLSVTTTANNSWVWAMVADQSNNNTPTAGTAQTIDASVIGTAGVGGCYWTLRQNATTATSGTAVTMNATVVSGTTSYDMVVFEVLATAPTGGGGGGGGFALFPALSVQVAFANNALTPLGSLTWTDISRYVGKINLKRGRTHELSRVEVGSLSMQLINYDDRFSPWNTASPYYGPFTDGNLLTANQASLEGRTTTGWAAVTNCTISAFTPGASLDGQFLFRMTSVAAGDMVASTGDNTSTPVSPNAPYTALASFSTGFAKNVIVTIRWLDGTGTFLSASASTPAADGGAWVQMAVTATAPAGARFAAVTLTVQATAGAGEIHNIDQIGLFSGTATVWQAGGTRDDGVAGLVPMKRVRVRATWPVTAGTTYDVFNGFVDTWPMNWPSEKEAYVEVTCSDAFKLLNLKKITSKYAQTVLADGASSFWRLGDPVGSLMAADSGPGGQPGGLRRQVGTSAFGVAGPLVNDPSTALDFSSYTAAGNADYVDVTGAGIAGNVWTVECWFKASSIPAGQTLMVGQNNVVANHWDMQIITSTGQFRFDVYDGAFAATFNNSPGGVCDGNWHHAALTVNGTALFVYLDGVSWTGTSLLNAINMSAAAPCVLGGSPGNVSGQQTFANGGFVLADVALYSGIVLTPAQIANHYALRTGFAQERTDQRIGEVLDLAGWPKSDRALEAGVSQVAAPTSSLSGSSLQHLYDVTDTENGLFSMAPNGQARFTNRNHVLLNATSATSQLTLGEGTEPYDLAGTTVAEDDLDIWNEVDVTRVGGVIQVATDAVSQARNGVRVLSRTNVLNTSDAETSAAASYLLSRYKDPLTRVAAVVVHPLSDPAALFPKVLGLDLLDQVTVTRSGLSGGTALNQPVMIEQIEHAIDPAGDWHTTWTLDPHDARQYLVLGDVRLGVLDSSRIYY